ncbi:MAG: aldo/keto reductase [Bacteroidota bacterium]
MKKMNRREASKLMGGFTIGSLMLPSLVFQSNETIQKRKIRSSGELLPVVGLGTWQSFDVNNDVNGRNRLLKVLKEMKKHGGSLIDSSPMYGSSERVVGDLTHQIGLKEHFFYATKVWINGEKRGIQQMEHSMKLMKTDKIDLMQIHNLIDWKTHLKTLKKWKEDGRIRYWGITHYLNSSHDMLARIVKTEKPDFVQFNYSIDNTNAEKNLLNIAKESGVSVIINRPFNGGGLFRLTKGKKLPEWCKHYKIESWAQFFLKYILSNEAVTAVIPGTSKPHHLVDNMMAGFGNLPDENTRRRMLSLIKTM